MARWQLALLGAPLFTATAWGFGVTACGAATRRAEPPRDAEPAARDARPAPAPAASAERYAWVTETRSPQPAPLSGDGADACTAGDAALVAVAERVARRALAELPPLEPGEIAFALRSHGAPYVWPRSWSLVGGETATIAAEPLAAWLGSFADGGERRCGIARSGTLPGDQAIAAVAVDVLADLEPLPTRVRAGAWLDVAARLLVPASHASVLVLGPRGRPHRVTASLDGSRVRARFRADREGTWLTQVLATVEGGPRPVAEAVFAAGGEPPSHYAAEAAPGESAAAGDLDPAAAVFAMLNAARHEERLPPLQRDPALDRLAEEHARALLSAQRLAHDLGTGGPGDRVRGAGLAFSSIAENLAHARNPGAAHRTLWASPSHRENLLHPTHRIAGVGAAPDPDGTVWVCQLFARR